jgi:integrase
VRHPVGEDRQTGDLLPRFAAFERLIEVAESMELRTHLVVLLGGSAGLRCGEMMALEWKDIDFAHGSHGQICVARSDWKHPTEGAGVRYVPMTSRLATAFPAHRA